MISKRAELYGRALFEAVSNQETLEELKQAEEFLKDKEILEFFLSFVVSLEEKKNLLGKIPLSKLFKNFLFLLLERKTISLISEIRNFYEDSLDEKHSRLKGEIKSPQSLREEEREQLEQIVGKFLKKKVELKEREDKSLIGGLYIKAGAYIFNDSLALHLKRFQTLGG